MLNPSHQMQGTLGTLVFFFFKKKAPKLYVLVPLPTSRKLNRFLPPPRLL